MTRRVWIAAGVALSALLGLGLGYVLWGWPKDWYHERSVESLPPGEESALVRYGLQLVVDTAAHIGKSATDPKLRYAGNDLACGHCHMNAGFRAYAMPFVSTAATYPALANHRTVTLPQRINQCMERSMDGRPLPPDGREMQAFIAYLKFAGEGAPEGVRLPGMGLYPVANPDSPADAQRGADVYRARCAECHGKDGEGQQRATGIGYTIPPLWGDDSFNAAAGMNEIEAAAAFIHANMPVGADPMSPLITVQEAWDVAAYMTSRPRPPAPPGQ